MIRESAVPGGGGVIDSAGGMALGGRAPWREDLRALGGVYGVRPDPSGAFPVLRELPVPATLPFNEGLGVDATKLRP